MQDSACGTTHFVFTPEDFIARLAALVPRPQHNLTRYHGVFAPSAALRSQITPAGRGGSAGQRRRRKRRKAPAPTTANPPDQTSPEQLTAPLNSESAGAQSVRCKNGQPHRLTLRRPLAPALTIHRRCPEKHSRRMIALFADKLIISTENNSLACRCQPGPQPNCYPRAIQTSETTPCVFLRSAGKARYASYPRPAGYPNIINSLR